MKNFIKFNTLCVALFSSIACLSDTTYYSPTICQSDFDPGYSSGRFTNLSGVSQTASCPLTGFDSGVVPLSVKISVRDNTLGSSCRVAACNFGLGESCSTGTGSVSMDPNGFGLEILTITDLPLADFYEVHCLLKDDARILGFELETF